MLSFVIILSLLSITYAKGDERPIVHLQPQALKVVKEAAAVCVNELKVNQEISDNFFKLSINNDNDTKKFLYCLCRKSNYADEDGHFNEAVLRLFEGNSYKDKVEIVIDHCNKIKRNDKFETMFQTIECFYKKTPALIGQ